MNIFWKVETKSFENAWPLKTFNYVLEKIYILKHLRHKKFQISSIINLKKKRNRFFVIK
jgi:hypothetical protein